MTISLRHYEDRDLALTMELETDPVAMAELGGPRDRAALEVVHERRITEAHYFVIEDDGEALGSVGAWLTEHAGRTVHETGWMVLPRAHGRGVATAGLGAMLELLRADPSVTELHAFPGVTNVASNRLCDHFGFRDEGEVAVDFADHDLRCRHRVVDVS